jgi:CheY-like chemotaxis protein
MLVLIVDDEPLVAQTLGLIFRKSGYNTEVVHTAEDAMSFVRKTPPNLVLCDIEMPIRDGLELMADLGEELPQCPILVLTGSYRSLSKVRARAGSLNQEVTVMVKPCQPLDLLATAGNLLKSA